MTGVSTTVSWMLASTRSLPLISTPYKIPSPLPLSEITIVSISPVWSEKFNQYPSVSVTPRVLVPPEPPVIVTVLSLVVETLSPPVNPLPVRLRVSVPPDAVLALTLVVVVLPSKASAGFPVKSPLSEVSRSLQT